MPRTCAKDNARMGGTETFISKLCKACLLSTSLTVSVPTIFFPAADRGTRKLILPAEILLKERSVLSTFKLQMNCRSLPVMVVDPDQSRAFMVSTSTEAG